MAVNVYKSLPKGLLAKIKTAIAEGHIKTWLVDSDGDFTHTPDQWKWKAWFRPETCHGKLVFNIIKNTNYGMTDVIYGVYHGRFIEMLLILLR